MRATLPTPREMSVLRLIAWGHTNKEIAGSLKLSVKTIETHKFNAMRKLKLRNRFEIVRHALAQGWLQIDALPHHDDSFNESSQSRICSIT